MFNGVCMDIQPEEIIGKEGEVSRSLVILVKGGLETYRSDEERVKILVRKGSTVILVCRVP